MRSHSFLRLILAISGLLCGLVVAFSAPARGDLVLNSIYDFKIYNRIQKGAPWCYAFAEEQLIKDRMCVGLDCLSNGSLYSPSIFDIVLAHARARDLDGKLPSDPFQLFADGSPFSLPYRDLGLQTYRSSHCTLEQGLFRISSMENLNPKHLDIAALLSAIYEAEKGAKPVDFILKDKDLELFDVKKTFEQLRSLARKAKSLNQYVYDVLNFTSCSDYVGLPQGKVKVELLLDKKEIAATLRRVLGEGRSVVLNLCAESLAPGSKPSDCTPHAVVAKFFLDGKVRLVDSNFIYNDSLNSDGSSWVPEEWLINGIAQYGPIIKGQQESVKRQIQQEFDSGMLEERAYIEKRTREYFNKVKTEYALLPQDQIPLLANYVLAALAEKNNLDVIAVGPMEFNSIQDLDKLIPPIVEGGYQRRLKEHAPMLTKVLKVASAGFNMMWFAN